MNTYTIYDQNNTPYQVFSITNNKGFTVEICELGASIFKFLYPDGTDIVVGYKNTINTEVWPHFGSVCGRVAGRISNSTFTLNGKEYHLDQNRDPHHLHGGFKGFSKQKWSGTTIKYAGKQAIQMKYTSADGEGGYPGVVHITTTYTLNEANELIQHDILVPEEPTIANITNHVYWNLHGVPKEFTTLDNFLENTPGILDHTLQLNANNYYEADIEHTIPTGEILSIYDTPFDFTSPKPIGDDIDHELCSYYNGYDHIFAVNNADDTSLSNDKIQFIAQLSTNTRKMEIWSSCPAVVLYTGNFLPTPHTAVCLETQFPADCPNKDHFPSIVVTPENYWDQKTIWRFS